MAEPLLVVDAVTQVVGPTRTTVLHEVSLRVMPGRLVALAGRSGSGKSSLCHLVAGLAEPTSGTVSVDGTPAHLVRDWATVSLLPQRLALVEELSVAENVLAPAVLRGSGDPSSAQQLVDRLLEQLDLAALADRPVTRTSLGEQQRTALARALVLAPRLAVLDEPTGHQDDEHVRGVLAGLDVARDLGCAVLVATHDERVLEVADEVVTMGEGRVLGRSVLPKT